MSKFARTIYKELFNFFNNYTAPTLQILQKNIKRTNHFYSNGKYSRRIALFCNRMVIHQNSMAQK